MYMTCYPEHVLVTVSPIAISAGKKIGIYYIL